LHARSLTPAIIMAIRSAFPDIGYMEYKGLANEITELVNSRKKESRQRLTQQERWIEGLQNHVRELYAHVEAARRATQAVATCLEIQGLPPSSSVSGPHPLVEPFSLYQSATNATPPPFPRGSTPTEPPPFPQGPTS